MYTDGYEYASCPYCGSRSTGRRNINISTVQHQNVICSNCHNRYYIEFGKGKIRASKTPF